MLWLLSEDARMSRAAWHILRTEGPRLWVSVVSAWEIVIKHQAGRLRPETGLDELLDLVFGRGCWKVLPVSETHILALSKLPMLHKDPFDRLLIAQAQVERLAILTADGEIRKYSVATVW